MRAGKAKRGCFIAGLALISVSAAQAAIWVNEFDDFQGTNAGSVSGYTDTDGLNPNSYNITFDGTASIVQAGPWLSQGDLGGNKSARFFNGSGEGNGRVRFSTALPASMDLGQGFAVAWRMKVGAANTTRGPIQIAATVSGAGTGSATDAFNAYIRLRNSDDASGNSYIDIQRNGGGLYKDLTGSNDPLRVDRLVLGSNLANEFHQWTAAVVYNADDNKSYWKLWLDGQLLQFGGPSGSPMLAGDQYSFRTFAETFSGAPYIGLGDLNNQDMWDFEFDYVNYRDDGAVFFVPEPGALGLLAAGMVLLGRRRRTHL